MGMTKTPETAGRLVFDAHEKRLGLKDGKLRRWIIISAFIFILHPDVLQLEIDWNRESCYE